MMMEGSSTSNDEMFDFHQFMSNLNNIDDGCSSSSSYESLDRSLLESLVDDVTLLRTDLDSIPSFLKSIITSHRHGWCWYSRASDQHLTREGPRERHHQLNWWVYGTNHKLDLTLSNTFNNSSPLETTTNVNLSCLYILEINDVWVRDFVVHKWLLKWVSHRNWYICREFQLGTRETHVITKKRDDDSIIEQ